MPQTSCHHQAVRNKAFLVLRFAVVAAFVLLSPLAGAPWWALLCMAPLVTAALYLSILGWVTLQASTPLHPLIDDLARAAHGIPADHARVFHVIGTNLYVLCLPGKNPAAFCYLRFEGDWQADDLPGQRYLAEQISIDGPLAMQYTVVDSDDPDDPLVTRPPSWLRKFGMLHTHARTGVLQPDAAVLRDLLKRIHRSQIIHDIPLSGAR